MCLDRLFLLYDKSPYDGVDAEENREATEDVPEEPGTYKVILHVDDREDRCKKKHPSPDNPSFAIVFLLLPGSFYHLLNDAQAVPFAKRSFLFHTSGGLSFFVMSP